MWYGAAGSNTKSCDADREEPRQGRREARELGRVLVLRQRQLPEQHLPLADAAGELRRRPRITCMDYSVWQQKWTEMKELLRPGPRRRPRVRQPPPPSAGRDRRERSCRPLVPGRRARARRSSSGIPAEARPRLLGIPGAWFLVDLPRARSRSVRERLLAPGSVHGPHRQAVQPGELPDDRARSGLPEDHPADGRYRGGGHHHRHRAGVPSRVLRGAAGSGRLPERACCSRS